MLKRIACKATTTTHRRACILPITFYSTASVATPQFPFLQREHIQSCQQMVQQFVAKNAQYQKEYLEKQNAPRVIAPKQESDNLDSVLDDPIEKQKKPTQQQQQSMGKQFGILLQGPNGSGKTKTMQLAYEFAKQQANWNALFIVTCNFFVMFFSLVRNG